MSWTAIVLAGSRPGRDPFAEQFGAELKALIPIAGEPMVCRPVRALLETKKVGKILVLSQSTGPIAAVLPTSHRIKVHEAQGTIAETIEKLILKRTAQFPIIVTTADHALLDGQMIAEFINSAAGADIAVGVAERRSLIEPNANRFAPEYAPPRKGIHVRFDCGSRSIKALAAIEQWRSVEQDRKKGWRVLSALGPAAVLGALLRMRTIEQTATTIARRLGMTARVVVLSNPLAAVDVDKPVDHAIVEAILVGKA
jgi:GTP:adenosylcobinamide-phosphate guanylyltransferase